MVAAVASNINPKTAAAAGGAPRRTAAPTRPPLLPSEPDNAIAPRRPRAREVTSRYMSGSSSGPGPATPASRRCPSPLVARTPAVTTPSAERRRVATPRGSGGLDVRIGNGTGGGGGGEVSAAQKVLFTSARSLSVSFQGESFSLLVSKVKQAPLVSQSPSLRKGTPERRKSAGSPAKRTDHGENSKPPEQNRWPGRSMQPNALSRSMDFTDERRKMVRSGNVVRALQTSMVDERTHLHGGLSSNSSNSELEKVIELDSAIGSKSNAACDPAGSDTDSVSSGSSSGLHDHRQPSVRGGGHGHRAPRGIIVPARFWQETKTLLRHHPDPDSTLPKNNGFKSSGSPKLIVPKKLPNTPIRAASPSKVAMASAPSPVRGMSPSRARTSLPSTVSMSNSFCNTPSILSFAVDIRRGKVGENRIGDAHQLRLFYNKALQWRFVNARAESTLLLQKMNAEKSLYTAWVSTSKLRDSVRAKRAELQSLRQNLKLTSILKGQMAFLEGWALMNQDYFTSLVGAIEALRASTLRLPVVAGATADLQKVKEAISSAVDVMQAMASSVYLSLSKVDEVKSLVSELANISAKERASLGQCEDLLSIIASMQVQDCSLRTHILQQKHLLRA